jgi:hypothetical protein
MLAAALLSVVGCGLDVTDPDIVEPEDVYNDPNSVPIIIAGLVEDFQSSLDSYVLFSGMFVDEFIHSSTYPNEIRVDRREIIPGEVGEPYPQLHTSRMSADAALLAFESMQEDPAADPDLLRRGLAYALYYGAYARLLLAEMYCQSILGGGDPAAVGFEPAPLLPDERMREALVRFAQAEEAAGAAGMQDLATAARIGRARAHMWLGEYSAAASLIAGVDPEFRFFARYSSNSPFQWNYVYAYTHGDIVEIRYTVGDGSAPTRFLEKFAFYDEWVDTGLIDPEPGPVFQTFDATIPVSLQLIYGGGEVPPNPAGRAAPIIIASGFEATVMQAEAAYRAGDLDRAELLINERLTTGMNPHGKTFAPVRFTGDFEADIREFGRAYSAGLWLTGHRLGFMRRVLRNDGVDLYPTEQPGRDTAFPIMLQEVDNNPSVTEACPTGPPWS